MKVPPFKNGYAIRNVLDIKHYDHLYNNFKNDHRNDHFITYYNHISNKVPPFYNDCRNAHVITH